MAAALAVRSCRQSPTRRGRRNDIVFLEALADDWPRLLYEKVGFDVVASRHLLLRRPHALTRLRLRTPRLELRLATVAELRALAEVARAGIHPPEEMPFKVPWTDRADEPGLRGRVRALPPAPRWTTGVPTAGR